MDYIQKFKSHPNSEKVHHHLKLTFNKKLVTGFLIALAIPLTVTLSSTRQDIEKHASEIDTPVVNGYIIKYKEAPLAAVRSTSISSVRPIVDRRIELNAANLAAKKNILGILGAKSYSTGTSVSSSERQVQLLGEYDAAFNGIALNISKEEAEKILNESPYVEAIYPNIVTKISLADSVPMIGADQVWQIIRDSGGRVVDGSGVNIAVIDTGVDYKHNDLGKSTGTQIYNSKIVGGKDFVNNDEDPMDDHGHGTHVASIIAGNGEVKGIAPKANIYAYKVFDASGSSDDAKILAAINYATQTREDTNSANDIDVINMSFSRYCFDKEAGKYYTDNCGPDSLISETIDNATAEGIISVVAAGNFGSLTGAVGQPGVARSALTVGSINKSKSISSFSSRGPVNWEGQNIIKPEVVAPGEGICASKFSGLGSDNNCLDSSHTRMNGTSMATPMVAGLASLVLQKYPSSNPSDIKYMITQSATNLGQNIDMNSQGYGLIDTRNLFDFDAPQPTPPVQQMEITAYLDSYVSSDRTGANYGDSTRIKIDGSPKKISYLKFDLTPLQGKRIISAHLKLNVASDAGAGSDNKFNIKKTGTSWSEGKLTYKNKPSTSSIIASFRGVGGGSSIDIDLKTYIASNLGSKVSLAITSDGTNEFILISKDASSNRPRILVEYQ